MKPIKLVLLVAIIPFLLTNCKKEENDVPAEFKLRVLNEQGQETTTFKEGENVIFSFLITNKTNESLTFYHGKMNVENFFELYKLNTAKGDISLRKPYKYIFCDKIGSLGVPANGSLDITVSWIYDTTVYYGYNGCEATNSVYHATTSPLSIGTYKTGFSSSFKIGGPLDPTQHDFEGESYKTDILNFEVKFTVK